MRRLVMVLILFVGTATTGVAQTVVQPVLRTAPLFNYDDAPATPDADDPAIWINRRNHQQSLIIGTAKDAGLLAYDLSGNLVQALFPPNAPLVGLADPATPAGLNSDATPCVDSASGETFGRYNNVDVAYDVRLGNRPGAARVDVAIVSDRGCDRVRFFKMVTSDPDGPLVDIGANVPVYSRAASSSLRSFSHQARLKDGSTTRSTIRTLYGRTVVQEAEAPTGSSPSARTRTHSPTGRRAGTRRHALCHVVRTFLFDTSFDLRHEHSVG